MANRRIRLTPEEEELIKCKRETGSVPPGEMVQYDRNILSLNRKYEDVRKKYKVALKELNERDVALELALDLGNYEAKKINFTRQQVRQGKQRHSISYAFALASDWHIGELVDAATVNGLNSFDLRIAQDRARRFFENSLYLIDLIRAGTNIPVFVLALLGDFICGEIRDEIREEALGSATEMTTLVVDLLCNGIDFLLKKGKFEHLILPCCFGNHGRNTPERRSSTAWKKSYEFLLYSFLDKLYRNDSRVIFKLTKGYHNYFDVFDKYKLRFHHGDNIKYQGGVGGISIPVNKAIAQWNKSPIGRNTFLDLFGHYHQSKSDNCWISNGSLVGYNAYALSLKADYEPPRQQFFAIEKDHGLTFPTYIFLE